VRKWLPHVIVVAAVVAGAVLLRNREQRPDTPEATVSALFDAAGQGDDEKYLRLLGGPLRRSLEQTRKELGPAAFRENLRRSNTGIKGLAVTRASDAAGDTVALNMELVFADRVERQRVVLVPERGGWAITSIATAAHQKPAVPYGTPVFEEPAVPGKLAPTAPAGSQQRQPGRDGAAPQPSTTAP